MPSFGLHRVKAAAYAPFAGAGRSRPYKLCCRMVKLT
jgi:hypothetical protein